MPEIPATTRRVVIESISPLVDAGRFAAKRLLGETVEVEADVFADGHDMIRALLKFRQGNTTSWGEVPMEPLANDRFAGSFEPTELGDWEFEVEGFVDEFETWRHGLDKKIDADVDISMDLLIGSELVAAAALRAPSKDAKQLERFAGDLNDERMALSERIESALSPYLHELMSTNSDRSMAAVASGKLTVDRPRAGFSAWYELFPRSWSPVVGRHGTLADVEKNLDYVASLGFDVLYLPPIHPIGTTHRKGRNNSLEPAPEDPGVPWAIGSKEGGHKAVNPELGTIEDFRSLVSAALDRGIEIALDIAFQASPDHPWVEQHPEWFKHRPDGSIQYAENPPKKYQDIFPIDFETTDAAGLWSELKSVFDHWIEEGVHIFRVDNPHTKAFSFWEWVIGDIRKEHPEVIFLAEAFTRPKVMNRLAKLGFTQSYTYFSWRTSRHDLITYMTDLRETEEFFRPNFWPNTPDILTEQLQTGGRGAFISRFVLAATLSSNYGIYGPAFELMESDPIRPGSEEYLDSEKYQIRSWDLDADSSLAPMITQMNRIRRAHPALQETHNVTFHQTDNESLIAFSKRSGDDVVLAIVNLDPHNIQSGWVHLDLKSIGQTALGTYQVTDLLTERRYSWEGPHNFVQLDPQGLPAHVLELPTPVVNL